ncbi:MAG: Crp/Fnr family transcriptional regulator [Vicinamibacterales bacterium]
MTRVMRDGRMAEVGTIGREGVVGFAAGFGEDRATSDAMVRIPNGGAETMSVRAFRSEMERQGALFRLVTRFMHASHLMVAQLVACNALHSAEERCARSLVLSHDRVGRNNFKLSHEFLAVMLGVRRPTATIVAGALQRAGHISYKRGQMKILNRRGLEQASCECYRTMQEHYERLLPGGLPLWGAQPR